MFMSTMADVNSLDGLSKSRSILGEITNLTTKRGLPEIESREINGSKLNENEIIKQIRAPLSQCTDVNPRNKRFLKSSNENRDAKVSRFCNAGHCSKACDGNKFTYILDFGRKAAASNAFNVDEYEVCSQGFKGPDLTDLERGRAANSSANDGFKKLDLIKGNNISTVAEIFSKGKADLSLIDPVQAVDALHEFVNVEASDKLGDNGPVPADTSRTVSETGGDGICGGKDFDACESKAIHMDYHEGDDHGADNFVLSQSGSVDCMFIPESQESRVFGIERCTESVKGDECADGTGSTKACSCSFCTKAAYIWLDVNYQDIKARVSAMKKSQKEAVALAEQTTRHETIDKRIAESSTSTVVSNLECDLMHQWRSLFQHVGDLLKEESNHLEARLQPLSDLREKYKAELKGTDAASTGKH